MQVYAIVIILCFGAVSAISASISNEQDGLESLPQELLRHIASQLPADDEFRFSLASPYLRKALDLNSAKILSARLIGQFGRKGLRAALNIEGAPPGVISEVVQRLLRSEKFDSSTVLAALEQAYYVGHCDLVDVLSAYLNNSSYSDSANAIFHHVCDDVTWLASWPLGELLRMHALPRATFLQVIAAKYRDSGYGSFFNDPAWYSQSMWYPRNVRLMSRSKSIMSHALHLYKMINQFNSTVEFSPIPFGHIASMQNLSSETQNTLESISRHRLCRFCIYHSGPSDNCFTAFSLLQLVLSPGSAMEFFKSASADFKSEFLFQAAKAGHLDWVKFMVNHDLWKNATMTSRQFLRISTTSSLEGHYFSDGVMRFADVLAVGDPVAAAYERIFHHLMNRFPSESQRGVRVHPALDAFLHDHEEFNDFPTKIVSDYIR